MQGVLSRLRIGTKLGASAFGFVIPIAVMAAIILNGYARDIRFSELELMGNRIIEPLVEIAAAAPLLGGDDAADREQAEAVIGGRIDELQDIHLEIGTDLQFTDEGLASRGREGLDAPGLRRIWNRYDGADASSRAAVARDLFGHALRMIAHAGDTSNLILDPDLDSYYLMDVTLLAVPLILDHLQMVASARELPPGDALITAALIERDLDRVTASINTAINEDANFYGVLGGMQAALQPALNSFRASATSVFGLLNAAAAGRESTEAERIAAATPMLAASHEFWTGVADQQNRLLRIRVDSYRRERAIALALSAAAVLAASVLVLVVARSIIRQARDTQAGLDAAAQRDLRVTIPAVTHDELGMAAAAAQSLITDLRQFVADLRKQSTNAQAYAEQLADGGSSLTSSTAGVATGLEELSATITAFSRTLQQIESNAAGQKQLADTTLEQMQALEQGYRQSLETMTKVAETAAQNASVSEHSAEVVSASISDVRAITTDLEAIGRQVRSAGEASAGVDTIVATVRDIADRTSLLAMNAAIEAAHAGERGRGFAVVAGEIRSLSAGTATALQQIESQLNEMRSTIGGAVETAGAAEQRIGRIVSDTETARDSLDTVRRNAASVGDMIGTIRESVSSQSDSVRTVADALGQLGEASSGVLMAIEEQTVGAREMVDTVESIRGSTERNQQIADDVSALSGALTEESRALDAQVSEYQL